VNLRRVDKKGKCFNCLETGHYSNQCPKPRREGPSARVNAIEAVLVSTQPSRDTGRATLEGKILILGNLISILFDSRASHIFISHTIVKSLSLKTENTIDPLVVSNPIGGTSYLNSVCKDLVLDISDVDFYCCAYVVDFEGYGLISGMYWLSYYGVVLDCEKRVVNLKSRMG